MVHKKNALMFAYMQNLLYLCARMNNPQNSINMKKIFFTLFAAALCLPLMAVGVRQKQADKDTNQFRYEIECAGNAIQGTYLVKVWSYSKKASVAENQCRKNAVHGVIFKGYGGGQGCVSQRPLANTPGIETQYETYFDSFFADGGEFQKYASIMEGTMETVKVGREYKVGCVVSVRKDDLRKALEAAGIIRGLNSGF